MDAGLTLMLGGLIASLVAIIKGAFPDLPANKIPLVVVALAAVVVGVGVASGEVNGTPLAILQTIVGQIVAALGLREGFVAAVPRASAGFAGTK